MKNYFINNCSTQSLLSVLVLFFALACLVLPELAFAQDYDIGSSEGPWAKIVSFLQDIVDLLGGPIAKFILFISLIMFVAAWIWNPASGAMGGFFRLLIGIVVIINAGAFLVSLGA